MANDVMVRDFYGKALQVGDIAAALVDMHEDGSFLALVRVVSMEEPYALVTLIDQADGLAKTPWSDTEGMAPWTIWPRKLIWHASVLHEINDAYVHDILGVEREA